MRSYISFLLVLIILSLTAQPKTDLTAGSESLTPVSQQQSITEPAPDQKYYSTPSKEAVIEQGSVSSFPEPKNTTSKDIIVLFAGLLIATAIYFMFRKSSAKPPLETPAIKLEDENTSELKKKAWKDIISSEENIAK